MPADPRKLSSGLPDDFDGVIIDAKYLFDERFVDDDDNPVCQLQLTIHSEDEDVDDQTPYYGCGPDWEPVEGGKAARKATDPDNDDVNFNGNTKVGKLITAIVKSGAEDEVVRRYVDDGVGSTDAAMYLGLNFHWARVSKPYKFKKDGQTFQGETEQLLPDKFLGAGSTKPKKKAPAKKAAAAKAEEEGDEGEEAKPAPRGRGRAAASSNGNGVTDEVMAVARQVFEADESLDFDGWLKVTIDELGEAAKSEAVMTWLTDTSPAGAWEMLLPADA